MTLILNTNGTYTIDLDATIKAQYNLTNVLTIDGVVITAATSLPYVHTFTAGVHTVKIYRTSVSGSYEETNCVLTDKDLLCKVINHVKSLPETERYKSQSLYLYYILAAGISNLNCTCQCDDLKTIYTDLSKIIEPCDCC